MFFLPVPRRHRRRLLLPPGLVALSGLLLLGCGAFTHLNTPRSHYSIIETPFFRKSRYCNPGSNFSSESAAMMRSSPICLTPSKLENFRSWYNFTFVGNALPDYHTLQHVRIISKKLQSEPDTEQGFRVKFAPGATYSNLIHLLDWLYQIKLSKYWIDTDYEPATLYSITEKPRPPIISGSKNGKTTYSFICGNVSLYPDIPTRPDDTSRVELPVVLSPPWRNTTLLLLLITLLSMWRLGREWRATPAA